MSTQDEGPEYVEFTHPQGNLIARVLVPSVGQAEAPHIRERVAQELARAGQGKVFVLDLSQVSLLSSMGLGVCVDLRTLAEKKGLRPVLFGMNRHLEDLFKLMRIERLFQVVHGQHALDQMLGS